MCFDFGLQMLVQWVASYASVIGYNTLLSASSIHFNILAVELVHPCNNYYRDWRFISDGDVRLL
jgi:hypothetical protein